ncbi:MAG TPA: GAF domain-containing protein [Candidatus Bathyarchaeia archaeon]|nr:GAF domain-containing protein [Candidatus Bathyarchaeia archaeon]
MGPTRLHGATDSDEIAALRAEIERLERDRARLLADEQARVQETKALAGIGRLLSERLDPDIVGQRIADSLCALLGGLCAVVYRFDVDSASLLALAVSRESDPTLAWQPVRDSRAGTVGLAIRERRTITSPDVAADPRLEFDPDLRRLLETKPDRAALAVPLLTQDRLIGVLAVRKATGSVFDPRAVQLAEALADQAALALDHARLLSDAERRRREAEILAELSRTIGASLDLETVLRRVTEAARELCRSDGAVIGLRVPESDAMLLRYWTAPWYDGFTNARVEPGKGLGGQVLVERRPMRTSDYLNDPRIGPEYRERIQRHHVRAEMAVPVLIDDRVEGLLYVDNRSPRSFTDQDEAILVRLAAQAALAIRNAQLFADEQLARGTAERLVRALRESQERFQFVARATNDAVWDRDLVSGAMWWNEGIQTLFGYAHDQVGPDIGWWSELIHEDDRERVEADVRAAIDRGVECWSAEYRCRRADGSYAQVYDRGYVLHDGDGRPTRMIGAMMDVTERRQLEDELRQAMKMEAVGRLAGGVAHDFNNLLTVITGRSALLLGRLDSGDPLRKNVEMIQKTADRAAGLTRQLLAFSRKQVLQRKILDLNATVGEMSAILRRLIGEDIDLLLTPGAGAGCVNADPGQLEQVLLNLAVNARDAMPRGGTLSVETGNVQVEPSDRPEALPPGPYAVLRVMDTGVGMDAATQARIFEPFFTTKEPGKGTGLGLSMVHGVVRQHGGAITVRSQSGAGTTFEILLPQVEAPVDTGGGAEPSTAAAAGHETILLVEDEEEVRALAREVLERQGYTVLEAGDGMQALEIAGKEGDRIDMVLTDVVMPRMSGRELVDRVRASRPATRVLYMSGYTEDAIIRHGVHDASTSLLSKPFPPAELIRKVREILDRAR